MRRSTSWSVVNRFSQPSSVWPASVCEVQFSPQPIDQVVDYALDLKDLHETSHDRFVTPVLAATQSPKWHPQLTIKQLKPASGDNQFFYAR